MCVRVRVCVCVCVVLTVLQANVMLEYPIAGAEQLLCRNLSQAESTLQVVDEDLDHVRDQCTTLEVGILTAPPCVCVHMPSRRA